MVSDLCCPSMCPYRRSLFYLISFSLCSYELICLAKDKTIPSSYTVSKSGYSHPLSPFFGIDGSIYTPPANYGLLHNAEMDIDISNQKYFYINYQYFQDNGGAVTAKTLNISKNTGPLVFRENTTNNNGGAIFSTNCNITDNKQQCCFINNATTVISSPSNKSGGAIQCSQLSISNNQGPCKFINNVSMQQGGAISSNNVQITDNYGPIILISNKCTMNQSKGGGIYGENCYITSNHAPITFMDNQSGCSGGIFSEEDCNISYNSEIIKFLYNSSLYQDKIGKETGGGAIFCTSCTITNNLKGVIFENNDSKRSAGAILAQNLTIQDNGPVLFLNNTARWGSALQSHGDAPKFYLSADYGDIVFKRNLSLKPWAVYRNALHSTPNMNLRIGARQGYQVKFYDAIENEHPSTSVIIFNPENYHLGTVLFSGADLSPDETNERSYYSFLRNTYQIAHGVVAVEDKAGLGIYKISQEEGILRLGNNAVIRTLKKRTSSTANDETYEGSSFDLTKLALNLPSILTQGANAPKIWMYPNNQTSNGSTTYVEDNNPTITLSGPLLLLDSDNQDPYDSLDLSSGITRVPLLYLCDNKNKKINTENLDIQAMNETHHYGYQGIWSPYWEEYTTEANNTSPETANTSHRYLYADWTPTGYIPNPIYRGDLVANALWQSAYNVTTGLHTLEHFPHKIPNREISGGGLGAYVLQKTRNSQQGFQLFSKGYSTEIAGSTETQHNFALSFAQFYSEIREAKFKNKVSSNCYFAGAQVQIPLFDENILTSASLGYLYSHSHVKTKNSTLKTTAKGHFHGHTMGSEICCMLPAGNVSHLQFRPFIKALGIHAIQESFKETGEHIRSFETQHPLINVALPIGVSCHAQYEANLKTDWKFQFAYTPTIYRQKPKIITTRWISNGSWITSGTPVDYHAGSVAVNNTTTFFDKISVSINYRGDFSRSTLCNFLNITSELQF
ncbi:polymorphic outer membrane protein middle domain-containing protein [Chlamydia psittaci]|uniref:polymorphic outer membrane protein middle domain-containing protein n=2 Tax=Chlamydia psittaci TaxID=83554 RepID=UPI0002113047|nr:polymorphic outer membrane protein middle domain-containing protein [Chlamydia psittaci]EPJ16103.1 autotransporter beta-domain protein [Chlamydia psittaci 02DC18]AEG87278.1 polymorphic outer membrane protein E family [Chlamydia psittaci 02DC15]AFS25396.1 autotransporter beta-domain protein [Chlamydia psittaci WC]ATQ71305.1 polymorphic membrane protein autotransporter adhesin [Chlamydia psittaci]ATQ72330.1 polymorphic membrane protein autotransporter adhesin [Chlamydia psittaci]